MRSLWAGTAICLVGCVVLIALNPSQLLFATGIVLGGTAFVLVVSITFYAVGRSEERERAARESGPNGPAT